MSEPCNPELTREQLSKDVATRDRAFYILPYELNKHIALQIENDVDLCSFQLVCRQAYYAVNSDQSVWRERFLDIFERVPTGSDFKAKYQDRRKILRAGVNFTGGYTRKERKCLLVVRELILNSCASKDECDIVSGLNYDRLLDFSSSTNILKDVLLASNMKPDPLLAIIQLLLTPWCLELDLNFPTWGFPTSQQAAYLDSKVPEGQIFYGRNKQNVNVEWLLHITNFFKYHMTRKEEYSLFEEYNSLDLSQRPKMWTGKLENQAPGLGKNWIGSYAFLDAADVAYLRQSRFISTDIFIDSMDGFQSMILDPITDVHVAVKMLFELFDRSSSAGRGLERSVAKEMDRKALYYEVSGYDHYPFNACIRVHPLPTQHGFPGWQRFSMVKFFHDATSSSPLVDDLWAYEGCVLPGGEMIVGRWFYLDPNVSAGGVGNANFDGSGPYSGPFIFWKTSQLSGPEAPAEAWG